MFFTIKFWLLYMKENITCLAVAYAIRATAWLGKLGPTMAFGPGRATAGPC